MFKIIYKLLDVHNENVDLKIENARLIQEAKSLNEERIRYEERNELRIKQTNDALNTIISSVEFKNQYSKELEGSMRGQLDRMGL